LIDAKFLLASFRKIALAPWRPLFERRGYTLPLPFDEPLDLKEATN
jgi:hypothetical protein